jgi:hypothetical protein
MADYGYYGSAPREERRKSSLLGRLFDLLMLLVTWAASLSLLLALFSQVVNPNSISWLSFFGLVYPIIYLVCLGCALYWIVRWRLKRAALMGLACLVYVCLSAAGGGLAALIYQKERRLAS